jgi:2-oxoglutarate dehydrogenase E2 component (dihydrolipoamide succinyltransferase)
VEEKGGRRRRRDEILIEVETDKVVLEVPAPSAGVLAEIVQADGATVAAEQLIARIDTEGKAALQRRPRCTCGCRCAHPLPLPLRHPAGNSKAGVAMPAAAKLLADNNLAVARWPAPAKTAASPRVMCWVPWHQAGACS